MAYSGQPFSAQVTAKNVGDTTTQNYQGTFAKSVTLSAVASNGGAAIGTASPGGALSLNTFAATAFASGVNTVTLANPVFTFATVPTYPTDVFIRALDSDSVSSLRNPVSSSVEGGLKVVSGRLKISNVYGSERLGLPMTATVQYYNVTGKWVTSLTDSTSAFGLSIPTIVKGPLVLANLTSTVSPDACASSVVFCNGQKTFVLRSANATGSADISLNAPSYLQGPAAGSARATFGIYKSPLIYRRENY
jgi:MSHA biogenesis protein MshQ